MLRTTSVLLALITAQLSAQSDSTILSAGYSAPAPIEVAPGQIVTLFFRGIKSTREAVATSIPLPNTLAGLSVKIDQQPNPQPLNVPLIAVRQQNECEDSIPRPICMLTAIRVQIPTELGPAVSKLILYEDGQASRTFVIRPIRDNSHIITTCDLNWDTNPAANCHRLLYHGDGTLVSADAPAKKGETLVTYAHGLGPTVVRIDSGKAAPTKVPLHEFGYRQMKATFENLMNAAPNLPRYFESSHYLPVYENLLQYIGLTSGEVGLYQINIKLPQIASGILACGGEIRTNALLKFSTSQGIENIPFCLEP